MTDPDFIVRLDHRPNLADMRRLAGGSTELEAVALERASGPKTTPAAALAGRPGYDPAFLGDFTVPLPAPKGSRAREVLPVGNDASGRLDYTHFTVVMSAPRRMAMFTAVNVEGARSVSIDRGRDVWHLDGRISPSAQLGEDLYADNRLDRGHLVRREDPNWGPDAAIANADTFHFTNCAPQMDIVNQKTWLGLENYILQNARAWKERVTVFTGPIFGTNDLPYRGALIPKAFWKVIAFVSDDGHPSATAYRVGQEAELGQLEAAFGAYKTYQQSVRSIEEATGLSFGNLSAFDGLSNDEVSHGISIRSELRSLFDVRV